MQKKKNPLSVNDWHVFKNSNTRKQCLPNKFKNFNFSDKCFKSFYIFVLRFKFLSLIATFVL